MGNFKVEIMRDGKAVRRADVQGGSDVYAAKTSGPVKNGLGREPETGEWIRITHFAKTIR